MVEKRLLRSTAHKPEFNVALVAVFFLIFGPKHGHYYDAINLVSFLLIAFYTYKYKTTLNPGLVAFFIYFYGIYVAIVLFVNGVADLWHLMQPWKALLNFVGISCLVLWLLRQGWRSDEMLTVINYAIYIHAVIVILCFFIPEVRAFMSGITGFREQSDLRTAGLTRAYGITSISMLLPFFTHPFIKSRIFSVWVDRIGVFLVFFSLFFIARVGLYLVPVILCVNIVWMGITGQWNKGIFTAFGIFSLVVSALIYGALNFEPEYIESLFGGTLGPGVSLFFGENLRWSLELFFRYSEHSDLDVRSFHTIKEFLFHNDSVLELLFGTGLYGRGDNMTKLYTDISYAHFFSMIGSIGLLLIIFVYLIPLLLYWNKSNLNLGYACLVLTGIIMVTNYKEATFFTRTIFSVWSLLAAQLYYTYRYCQSAYRKPIGCVSTS